MKYYVYAGYYENFISGHKLPKPYTLRDEFKTFDEALDYVWENWEDDDIFFTEDVIDDAIDNGVIDDENWKDYLMEESKKSTRKSIKESKNMTFSFKESELFVDIKHIIDSEKINLHKKISTDFVYNLNEFKDICDELCKTENLYYIVYENKTSFKGDYNLVFFDIDDVDMRRNGEITFTVISDYNKEVIKFFNE